MSVYRPFDQRAYWLVNPALAGQTIGKFCQQFPEYQIENVDRGDQLLGADPGLLLELDALTKHMGLDPEVPDARALNIALDEAVILVTHQSAIGKALKDFSSSSIAGQVQLMGIERGGATLPIGLETKLSEIELSEYCRSKGLYPEQIAAWRQAAP